MNVLSILEPIRVLALAAVLCCLAQPSGAADVAPIRIGAVLPFSGGVELYGNQAKLGLDLAAREINASGGRATVAPVPGWERC